MNSVPAVTNNSTVDTTVDTTPPTLTSAIDPANGDWVQFLFSETLQQSNLPPASAFTVTADGSAVTNSLRHRCGPLDRQQFRHHAFA